MSPGLGNRVGVETVARLVHWTVRYSIYRYDKRTYQRDYYWKHGCWDAKENVIVIGAEEVNAVRKFTEDITRSVLLDRPLWQKEIPLLASEVGDKVESTNLL